MSPPDQRREGLVALYRTLSDEWDCPLRAGRTHLVFGSGNANADLMFVGEAPGANEDRLGKPFVGRAGKLLDELLREIGLERADAFIANVLKCRPPGNRDPQPDEIEECSPHLMRQIELIEPRVVCTLGNFATKLLSGSPQGITKVHGRAQSITLGLQPVQLYPIFHPAAALRTPAMLDGLREDFQRLPALLEAAREPVAPAVPVEPLAPLRGGGVAAGVPSAAPQLDLFS